MSHHHEDFAGLPGDDIKEVSSSTLSQNEREYLKIQRHPSIEHQRESSVPVKKFELFKEPKKNHLRLSQQFLEERGKSILCGCWSPQGHQVAVGCSDGTVQVMRKDNGQVIYKFGEEEHGTHACPAVKFANRREEDVNVLFTAQGETINQYHVSTGQLLNKACEIGNVVLALDVRPDNQKIASGGEDACVRVYDTRTMKDIIELKEGDGKHTAGHNNHIYSVLWHPTDPQVLLSSGWDQTVLVWDLRVGQSVRSIFGTFVCGGDGLDINQSKQEILTASWRVQDTLQLWDYGTGQLISNVEINENQDEQNAVKLYAAKFVTVREEEMVVCGGSVKGEEQQSGSITLATKDGQIQDHIQTLAPVHSLSVKGQRGLQNIAVACQDRVLLYNTQSE